MLDPRLPVIIGVGQVNHQDGDSPEPVELLAEAARRAAADSGGRGVLAAVESVRIVNLLSRRYPDPGALVAARLGIEVGETIYTTAGGHELIPIPSCHCIAVSVDQFLYRQLVTPAAHLVELLSSDAPPAVRSLPCRGCLAG